MERGFGMNEYMEYLKRYIRGTNKTLEQAHKELVCRMIAVEYGVSNQEMELLDNELAEA